jgi:hypothetical protein
MPTPPGLSITPAPTWQGRLIQPLRRVLLRLMAPMMNRFLTAHDELWAAHLELERRLEDTNRRLDLANEEIAAANALVWDQVALSRRLAQIEDQLASSEPELDGASSATHSGHTG